MGSSSSLVIAALHRLAGKKRRSRMGFDFIRKDAWFYLNNQGWWDFIELALRWGWKPTGTGPPRGVLAKKWCGAYFSNDGQLLYARDLKRLAAALQKAADAPPAASLALSAAPVLQWLRTPQGFHAWVSMQRQEQFARALGGGKPAGRRPSAGSGRRKAKRVPRPWLLTAVGKACLRDFIKFCHRGSARLY